MLTFLVRNRSLQDIRNYFGSKGGGKKAVKKDETAKKPLEEVVDLDGGGDDDDFAVSRSGKARAVSESATKRQSRTRGASKEAQKMVAAATATVTKKKPPALSRGKKRSVQISSDEEFEEEGEEEDDEDDDDEAMYVEAKSPPVTRRRKRRSGKNDVDDDDKDEVRIVETKKPRREPDNRPETIHKPEPMPVFEAKVSPPSPLLIPTSTPPRTTSLPLKPRSKTCKPFKNFTSQVPKPPTSSPSHLWPKKAKRSPSIQIRHVIPPPSPHRIALLSFTSPFFIDQASIERCFSLPLLLSCVDRPQLAPSLPFLYPRQI